MTEALEVWTHENKYRQMVVRQDGILYLTTMSWGEDGRQTGAVSYSGVYRTEAMSIVERFRDTSKKAGYKKKGKKT